MSRLVGSDPEGQGSRPPTCTLLRRELAELRRERLAAERDAAALDGVLAGIALTRRERDAGISPAILGARRTLETVLAAVEELEVALARIHIRLAVTELPPQGPRVQAVQRAGQHGLKVLQSVIALVNAAADGDS